MAIETSFIQGVLPSLLILEDSTGRVDAMRAAARELDPVLPVLIWDNAVVMRQECIPYLPIARVISLDYDLSNARGKDGSGPGTGGDMVRFLLAQPPSAPVIIHTALVETGQELVEILQRRGWRAAALP